MGKIMLQFSVLVLLFLSTFFLLGKIDFMNHFEVKKISKETEDKLGNLIMESIRKTNTENETDSVKMVLDSIKNRICKANSIDPADIHLHLINSDVVNAFALPGNHIVVYTGLIKHCDSVSELCGVLSHEIGHLQLHHVIKRLASEVTIGVLATAAGNGNSAVITHLIKLFSSSAFERKQESDADVAGLKYLEQAHINPRGFINIMEKFADMQAGTPKQMEWISSHPDSRSRAGKLISLLTTYHTTFTPVITDDNWQILKDASVSNDNDEAGDKDN